MLETKNYPKLRSIYLYITNSCNLNCRHCWVEAGPMKRGKRLELNFDSWKKILKQAIGLGLKCVKFTGGEPLLLYDTTYNLLQYLRDRKIKIRMETNGTLLDKKIADFFAETKGSFISVSIDGPNADLHDNFRCVKGCFSLAIKGIQFLAERNVNYQIICCIHHGNVHKIKEMIKLAINFNAKSIRFLPVCHMGRGKELINNGIALTMDEKIQTCQYIQNVLSTNSVIKVSTDLPPAFSSMKYLMNNHCFGSCGLPNMCGMLSDGTLALCGIGEHNSTTIYGNALEKPLNEIWENEPLLIIQREKLMSKINGICCICMFRELCRGHCRACSVDKYNDLCAPYPFCQEAYEQGLFPINKIVLDFKKAKVKTSI